jgi:acyl carrier protein
MDDIGAYVIGAIREIAGVECGLESNLRDLGMDSMCVIELVMSLEMEHDITLPTNKLPNLRTVQDVVAEVRRQKGAGNSP